MYIYTYAHTRGVGTGLKGVVWGLGWVEWYTHTHTHNTREVWGLGWEESCGDWVGRSGVTWYYLGPSWNILWPKWCPGWPQ